MEHGKAELKTKTNCTVIKHLTLLPDKVANQGFRLFDSLSLETTTVNYEKSC
jgi:hypothetical protein